MLKNISLLCQRAALRWEKTRKFRWGAHNLPEVAARPFNLWFDEEATHAELELLVTAYKCTTKYSTNELKELWKYFTLVYPSVLVSMRLINCYSSSKEMNWFTALWSAL